MDELDVMTKLYRLMKAQPGGAQKKAQGPKSVNHRAQVVIHRNELPLPPRQPDAVRFVAISDTHTHHSLLELPLEGDVLLHCGDFTNSGTLEECDQFCRFMAPLGFRHKLLVPGNHDLPCDAEWYEAHWQEWHEAFQAPDRVQKMLEDAGIRTLNGDAIEVFGITLFGSPLQPRQPKDRRQMAFGRRRGAELKAEWARVPDGVDVLLTHTPPAGVLDTSKYSGKDLGCEELRKAVGKTKPAVHVFGHIHAGYGIQSTKHTHFINAASAIERRGEGGRLNPPIVFDVLKQS